MRGVIVLLTTRGYLVDRFGQLDVLSLLHHFSVSILVSLSQILGHSSTDHSDRSGELDVLSLLDHFRVSILVSFSQVLCHGASHLSLFLLKL